MFNKDVLNTIREITTPKSSTQLTEQQILNEGAFSKAIWEFCVYLSQYVSGVFLVIIIFFAWLLTATVFKPIAAILGFVGSIPKGFSILFDEIKKARRIYEAKQELSPEDIKRITEAAKGVYNLFGPRTKQMITRYSNQLTSMNLDSPHAQDEAAKMIVSLKAVIASGENKKNATSGV